MVLPLCTKIDDGADLADDGTDLASDLDRFFFIPLRGVSSCVSRETSSLKTDGKDVFRHRDDMLLPNESSADEIDPSSVEWRRPPAFFF